MAKIKLDLESPENESSRLVFNRVQQLNSDYWRAAQAYARGKLKAANRYVAAGFIEVDFIKMLMDAETAERVLGEGEFFEFADKSDPKSNLARLESGLNRLEEEFTGLLQDIRER